jgi:hypothetical protein
MKTLQEFQDYFERELRPKLVTFQTERDASHPYLWRWWRWVLLAAIAISVLMGFASLPEKRSSQLLTFVWFATLIVLPVIYWVRYNRWAAKYSNWEKNATLMPAIRFLAPEFEYSQTQYLSEKRVRTSRIFESCGDIASIDGDDYFTGRIGKTAVEFSEVRVTIRDRTLRDDKGDPVMWRQAGMFLVADLNKPFQHATLVMPDPLEQKLGTEAAKFISGVQAAIKSLDRLIPEARAAASDWRPIRLEHLEFERLFQVYCTDPVEAHYILTPDVMERIAAFQKGTRFALTLSFIDTAMHAFILRGALFEGDVNADRTSFAAYQPYYEQLHQVFDLVEAMHLNTRLWTKT